MRGLSNFIIFWTGATAISGVEPGSKAHERYSLIRSGMSVREVVYTTFKKLGEIEAKRVFEDLKWDMDKQRHFYRLVRPS